MLQKPFISVVSPVYEGEQLLTLLVNRTQEALHQITNDFEIILVDDGSSDNSVETMRKIAAENLHVKCIVLDRNYGQHIAIKAGLDYCTGDWVVVMDCDLQDQPEAIVQLMQKATEGFDAVFASRIKRNDPPMKQIYSAAFYKVLAWITGITTSGSTANFGVYRQSLIREICKKQYHKFFFPVAVRQTTTLSTNCPVEHGTRAAGTTTYTFWKAFTLATKVIFSNSIFNFLYRKKQIVYGVQQFINFE